MQSILYLNKHASLPCLFAIIQEFSGTPNGSLNKKKKKDYFLFLSSTKE